MKTVRVFTHIPSPYQVELFDAVARKQKLELEVCYLYSSSQTRLWEKPKLHHAHIILDDVSSTYEQVKASSEQFDLVVYHYYQHSSLLDLIKHREQANKAWCFWGERPGYRGLGWLGALYRRWVFSTLHRSKAPVWGMGRWAVAQYRKECGDQRLYCNVPYFSDLNRFKPDDEQRRRESARKVFLYSGSMIHRKGVDLLARAFNRLADEFQDVSLKLVGDGELRPRLEKQLARHADRVEFAGFQKWEDLPGCYHTADVLCAPSLYDGWNLVIPEGLAAGLPVIGTDRTGAALELIRPRENGWLIPAGDAKALYQSMREVATLSRSALAERSAAAEKSVLNHSLAKGADRFSQAVESTLAVFSGS
ncbi:MAG TPA: glycosyltransferase family 4 protein [Pyrinomonadaceae bacterium]|jgi:glycosyltransferase involved in cell wall biosynthesis